MKTADDILNHALTDLQRSAPLFDTVWSVAAGSDVKEVAQKWFSLGYTCRSTGATTVDLTTIILKAACLSEIKDLNVRRHCLVEQGAIDLLTLAEINGTINGILYVMNQLLQLEKREP